MSVSNLVSIITPSYNCAKYIGETIRSIQAQTYPFWELLITDDCSSDDSCQAIEAFAKEDPRIKLLRLDKNSGAGAARNNSIDKAKGRYIAFCDSDDKWFPDKLEKQLEFMRSKDAALSHTSYMTCNENGDIKGIVVCRKKETLTSMCKDDKMGFLTVIYDTDKVGKVYLPLMRKRQDWALKLKILKLCNASYGMKEPLSYYRLRQDSISNNKRSLIKYNIAVYKEILGWSAIRANLFFYFIFLPTHFKKRLFLKYLNR
ncbi:MAG: glycosyltransferase family 2 protein [Muribaculaceae bacterium]|nr:glycosyltransferase family 2 protein [Muribaculaceae bacterium]